MWLAGVVPYTLAPQRRWRICWGEGKGHPGAQTKSGFRGADLSVGPPRSFRLLPTAVKAGQVKGRDPGWCSDFFLITWARRGGDWDFRPR